MKAGTKVTLGTTAIGAATIFALNYLGYITTITALIPERLRSSLMSDPYPLYAAIILFAVGIILLFSVARDMAAAVKEYRIAKDRAWAFSAEMEDFKHVYETAFACMADRQDSVEQGLVKNSELLNQLIEKVDAISGELNTVRERIVEEVYNEAKAEAGRGYNEYQDWARRMITDQLIPMSRGHADQAVKAEVGVRMSQIEQTVHSQVDARLDGLRADVYAELEARLKEIAETGKLS